MRPREMLDWSPAINQTGAFMSDRKVVAVIDGNSLMLDLLRFHDRPNSFRKRLRFQVVETENSRMMVC